MPLPVIPTLPAYPIRGEDQDTFSTKANATVAAMSDVVTKQNELGAWVESTAADVNTDALAAAASETAALAAYQQAVAIAATYTDIHQGAWASAPSTRNDATALQVGDLYYNTVSTKIQVWS